MACAGLIYYFHGGGFVGGKPEWGLEFGQAMAKLGWHVILASGLTASHDSTQRRLGAYAKEARAQTVPVLAVGVSSGGFHALDFAGRAGCDVVLFSPVLDPCERVRVVRRSRPALAQALHDKQLFYFGGEMAMEVATSEMLGRALARGVKAVLYTSEDDAQAPEGACAPRFGRLYTVRSLGGGWTHGEVCRRGWRHAVDDLALPERMRACVEGGV